MDAIAKAESIRKSIFELSKAENMASLRALGIPVLDDESESEVNTISEEKDSNQSDNPNPENDGCDQVNDKKGSCELNELSCEVSDQDINSSDESNSVNPDDWLDVTDLNSEAAKNMISMQRKIYRKKASLKAAKKIAVARLLKRKLPKRVSRVLKKYPNIGDDIETFVRERKVGADAWRRTGVLTFTYGKTTENPGQRVTYGRIKKHLEEKYNTKLICLWDNRPTMCCKEPQENVF